METPLIVKGLLLFFLSGNVIVRILLIGDDRSPITRGEATATLVVNTLFVVGILKYL